MEFAIYGGRQYKFIVYGKSNLSKESFDKVKNDPLCSMPKGGLMAYFYDDILKYKSSWGRYCVENNIELGKEACIFTLKPETRGYIIDDQEDLIKFIDLVGSVELMQLKEFKTKFQIIPNFEKASTMCDCIILTYDGQSRTKIPRKKKEYNLYEWKTQTVFLMNFDCIKSWEKIRLE